MIFYEKIKLVIWDLDDTFWRGTLSEGKIQPIERNIQLVKRLAERGIVSAICSKNDFSEAQKQLDELGIWDYFVFNSIDWTAKGQRIANLIVDMALRPENVLFVDDNNINLNEASYCASGLMTGLPEECLDELTLKVENLGKEDLKLSRLKQYKILEKKRIVKNHAASNEEFLRNCNIRIQLHHECKKEKDRIAELVIRSNQLNYTKVRSSVDELEALFEKPEYECVYITAQDNFGEYGIIGFYVLNKETKALNHFLFSCRTMGMGIEQFVYAYLQFPALDVEGEVATALNLTDNPDWITIGAGENLKQNDVNKDIDKRLKILFKGPCDTDSSLAFIQEAKQFETEFTFVNQEGIVVSAQNTTFHALQSLEITEEQKRRYRECIPFWDDALYETKMFDEKYDIVFFSVFKEAVSGLYEDRETGFKFVHDDWFYDATDEQQWKRYTENSLLNITSEQMTKFSDTFRYKGRIQQEEIVKNLVEIRQKLAPGCLLVISVPTSYSYMDKENPIKNDRAVYNKTLIKMIEKEFLDCNNVRIIDYSQVAASDSDFLETSNHFTKKIYYEIAQQYKEIISQWSGKTVSSKSQIYIFLYEIKDYIRKNLRKNKVLVKVVRKMKN